MSLGRPGALVAIPLLGACALFTLREHALAGRMGLPLDDAWIHSAIARNLAEGRNFGFVEGEASLPCSTSPLWTGLEALGIRAGKVLAPEGGRSGVLAVAVAKGIGLASGLAACGVLAGLAFRLTESRGLALLAGTLLGTQPRFVWGVLSGLEVPLYVLLTLLGLGAHVAWRDRSGIRRHLATACFALAGLARPELLAFAGLVFVDRALFGTRRARPRPGRWRDALGLVLAAVPLLLVNFAAWGRPFPTTYYVKVRWGGVLDTAREGGLLEALAFVPQQLSYLGAYSLVFTSGLFLPLLLGSGRGAVRMFREPGRPASLLPLGFLAFTGIQSLVDPIHPLYQSGRTYMMLPPIALLIGLSGLGGAATNGMGRGRGDRNGSRARLLAGGIALLSAGGSFALLFPYGFEVAIPLARAFYLGESALFEEPLASFLGSVPQAEFALRSRAGLLLFHAGMVAAGFAIPWRSLGIALLSACALAQNAAGLLDHASVYARNVRDVEALDVAAGKWIGAHLPTDATVAVHDLGAIAYFGRRRVLDLEGIASPSVLGDRRRDAAGLADVLRARRPTHYAGGRLGHEYGGAFQSLRRSGEVEAEVLHHLVLPENITVVGSEVVIARLRWR